MSDTQQEFQAPHPDGDAREGVRVSGVRMSGSTGDGVSGGHASGDGPPGGGAVGDGASSSADDPSLNLEPMAGLEWSHAIELPLVTGDAASPADLRVAWVHRAPLSHVLALYRAAGRSGERVPSPWWLRALSDGKLESRDAGFRIENRVHKLLSRRPGWEFVPWADDGESGFWEFLPSEGTGDHRRMPTTIVNTSRHTGWIDMFPAHESVSPEPVAIGGLAALRARLGEIEAVR
ncbi:hypothetical protein FHS23_000723 [Prauserella isguenensis]|uniref:Uncharacterized protein n=2 Tax=Prauserella isguenensis TaxID=1470180 RepID=A0A839RVM8_9PSEU|nr:hypothetical protein [Prauserella isguenensis]